MPALLSLAFFLNSLYHKFATQGSLFTCAEFVNNKILKHNVRQMRSIWILELLYHKLKIRNTRELVLGKKGGLIISYIRARFLHIMEFLGNS